MQQEAEALVQLAVAEENSRDNCGVKASLTG
jgi:hypothetical protein